MSNQPEVTIIIVNYNTQHEILACLKSIQSISYPKDKYRVVIFDNNSTDLSKIKIQEKYPNIPFIAHTQNIGFGPAINAVVSKIETPYFVLLNPDTIVTKDWLSALVSRIESSKQIAAVNSLSYLDTKYTDYSIHVDTHSHTNNSYYHLHGNKDIHLLHNNHFLHKKGSIEIQTGLTFIQPLKHKKNAVFIESQRNSTSKAKIIIQQGNNTKEYIAKNDGFSSYRLNSDYSYFVVQNAGNLLFKSGFSRDRGAVIGEKEQIYYPDAHAKSYFHSPAELQAVSGVSCIIRTKAFKEVHMFDPDFFMYYEDIDLSIRLRKKGYKLYFEPDSVVYHKHSTSSGEWSSFFRFHTDKGRLLLLLKHFPLPVFIYELLLYTKKTTVVTLKLLKYKAKSHWELADKTSILFHPKKNTLIWIAKKCLSSLGKKKKVMQIIKNTLHNKIYSQAL